MKLETNSLRKQLNEGAKFTYVNEQRVKEVDDEI